jgi:hypothetical protein
MRESEARTWENLLSSWAPPARLLPSEWAEQHIVLTDGDRPGPIRYDRGYQFQREVIDAFYGPFRPGEVRRVGCAYKGAQSGVTLQSLIGDLYWAVHCGVSVFHMMPRQPDADDKAKVLGEMIAASPLLADAFRSSPNRVKKTKRGQVLRVPFSNSIAEIKNWQAGVGTFDEVDELEAQAYDAVGLGLQRMGSYRRTIEAYISTPTLPDFGIHALYERSDQRQWWVPCPLCGEVQRYTWEGNIRWDATLDAEDSQAATARMACCSCEGEWDSRLREHANAKGRWVPLHPERSIIGFDMNRLMVPTGLPEKMVADYLRGLRSDVAMREHVNQNLGEVYLPTTGKLNEHTVEMAIDPGTPWGRLPPGGPGVVTVGVDVQGDAEPFDYVWEAHSYNAAGRSTVMEYGVAREAALISLLGAPGRPGKWPVSRALLDITSGHHKAAVERICAACPVAQPARFDHYRKTSFDRGKVVKVKKGHGGFSVNVDDALQDHLGRFFESGENRRITIAHNPQRAREVEWVDHYTRIARVREETPNGPIFTYRKLREKDVDYPYAGALACYAYRLTGGEIPGGGKYGAVKDIVQRARAASAREGRPSAKSLLRIVSKGRGIRGPRM